MLTNLSIPILVMISGWLAGGLVNYLADVLPARRRLVRPFCLQCQQPMGWVAYLVWPRQCKECQRKRSVRCWITEAVFITAAVWLWVAQTQRLGFMVGLVWLCYFGVVIIIDLEHRLILHPVSWFGATLGLVTGVWLHGWLNTLIGGAVGFGIMLVFYWLGIWYVRAIASRKGRPIEEGDAFGFGDVNLSGVIGLLLGWPGILAGLSLAVLVAGVVTLAYLAVMVVTRRYTPNMALPYGPFLAASAIFLLYFR